MSSFAALRPKTASANGEPRMRSVFSPLGLHWAGVAVLALVNLFFLAQMAILWQKASSRNAAAISQQRIELKTAEIAAQPLRGLDAKLALATTQADTFYKDRLPASYSEMLTEVGVLTKRTGVRLVRNSYDPQAVLPGAELVAGDQISIEAYNGKSAWHQKGGKIATLEETNDIGFQAVEILSAGLRRLHVGGEFGDGRLEVIRLVPDRGSRGGMIAGFRAIGEQRGHGTRVFGKGGKNFLGLG